ncbi:MAG: DUF934 domain-containing protein [Proteobacteria bacterium]|nr:DUF934 domain-containing protein [Pseudomonadota bacterium]MDA1309985.1 DUF934 domain-containing protein [Pseudomonadota bacterium]
MPIVKDGRIIENEWTALDGGDPLEVAPSTPLLVTQDEFRTHAAALSGFARLGLKLEPGDAVEAIAADLQRIELIVLVLPKFNDGRAFSQARLLRDRHAFKGEIRATGHVLIDQFGFLQRSGVDAVAMDGPLSKAADEAAIAKAWEREVARFQGHYQPAQGDLAQKASMGLRRWARSPAVVGLAAGAVTVHEVSCAGAWAY